MSEAISTPTPPSRPKRRRRMRNQLATAAGAVGAVMALAAPAVACVYFNGTMTVTAQTPGHGRVGEVGDGGYMTSCARTGSAAVSQVSTMTVSVAPGTCLATTRLPSGIYTVSIAGGTAPCMDMLQDRGASGIDIGSMIVDGAGVGSGVYPVPPQITRGTHGVCVTGPIDAPARGLPPQGGGVSVTVI
ncbi:MAG: hypothetical protein M3256_10855 [Actinomycetota bacterium]|nr:hypothetical protein [Actinomycetota bacterium]